MNKITDKHREVALQIWGIVELKEIDGPRLEGWEQEGDVEATIDTEQCAQILADAFPEQEKGSITYLPTSLDPKARIRELEKQIKKRDEILEELATALKGMEKATATCEFGIPDDPRFRPAYYMAESAIKHYAQYEAER